MASLQQSRAVTLFWISFASANSPQMSSKDNSIDNSQGRNYHYECVYDVSQGSHIMTYDI